MVREVPRTARQNGVLHVVKYQPQFTTVVCQQHRQDDGVISHPQGGGRPPPIDGVNPPPPTSPSHDFNAEPLAVTLLHARYGDPSP